MKKNDTRSLYAAVIVCIFTVLFGLLLFSTRSFAFDPSPTPIFTLEAEDGVLSGIATVNGEKVGNLGKCGGDTEGTVRFENLTVPENGRYTLRIFYYSGSTDRYFQITAGENRYQLDCPSTGSFSTVGQILLDVELYVGDTLTVGSDWYGPDLDKIEIFAPDAFAFPDKDYEKPETVMFQNGNDLDLTLDVRNGTYSLLWKEGIVLENAHAEAMVDEKTLSSDAFSEHTWKQSADKNSVFFIHSGHPDFDGTMTQVFYRKEGASYLLTEVLLTKNSGEEVATNYISPMASYQDSLKVEYGVFLQMPFDNDMWGEPKFIGAQSLGHTTTGYEVAAFYNEQTAAGFVFGSVEHDTWKTGVQIYSDKGRLMGVNLFGGVSDGGTRDTAPHGTVSGQTVSSPLMFLGYFTDWREGLTEYGKANAEVVAPKKSTADVPFGYNSWGSLQSSVSYSDMIAVSDYIKTYLQPTWSKDDTAVYVNVDSYWDYITENDPNCDLTLDEALQAFVLHCRENGQQAGIYYTPFTAWHSDTASLRASRMEGSSYRYYDAALRLPDGSLYGKLDGGYALDPTHPGTIARMEFMLNHFMELGFTYVKLDFMTHGALEGDYYEASVTTGMQAYNFGMAKIAALCKDTMYVNLSIAPLFPYQYADGRRISCDAFSSLDHTQHVLSYLTACFWEEEIYPYPDPDHLVVLGSSEGEARCRVTSGVISGTSFLVGDDLTTIRPGTADHQRILQMFANPEIVAVAKLGRTFLPVSVSADRRCADAYYCEVDGSLYLAVFNFENSSITKTFDLSTITDLSLEDYTATDLWQGSRVSLDGSLLHCKLPQEDALLLRISQEPEKEQPNGMDSDPPSNLEKTDIDDTQAPNSGLPWMPVTAIAITALLAGTLLLLLWKRKR